MISARLAGDDAVLDWLRASPDAAVAGLARVITKLGIDLQRRTRELRLTEGIRAARFGLQPNVDLQIEADGNRVAARVAVASNAAAPAAADVKARLHRIKTASRFQISGRAISLPSHRPGAGLSEHSFLRSALEDMEPEIRDEVDGALREALTRG